MQPVEAPARTSAGRFWRHPLAWIWFAPVLLLVEGLFLGPATDASAWVSVPLTVASGLAALGVYSLVMRRVAHRRTPELARRGAVREAALGAGVGAGFIGVSIGLVALIGGFSFGHGNGNALLTIVTAVVAALAGGLTEELAFRGIALQAVEKVGGTWWAIGVTALLFGGAHALNPDASLWSSVAIAVEAGVLLGAAYAWRRNIWFAVGLHAAWNAIEQLLGVPVSGHRDPSLTTITAHGSTLVSGGSFGVEASVVPVLVSLLLAVPMLLAAKRNHTLYPRKSVVAGHQAGPVGVDDRLHPVAQIELGQDAGHEGLDRLPADHEFLGDLGVRQTAGHQR